MDIKKIVSNVLLEAIKKKDYPVVVAKKLADAYPGFNTLTDEQKMQDVNQIINRYEALRASFNENNSTYFNFILQHDGRNRNLEKVDPRELSDIAQAPIKILIKLLHLMSGEKFPDLNLEKVESAPTQDDNISDEELAKKKLDSTFNENGYLPTEGKIEASKEMWYSDENAIINEDGFRVYQVVNEQQADRMGYYYESLFIQQIKKLRADNPDGDWSKVVAVKQAPWCHIWRGSAYRGYTVKDPDTGQALYDHSVSKYGDRREAFGYTLYEIIDESINPLEDIVEKGQFHMCTLIVKPNGGFMLSPMLNAGEISKNWNMLVNQFPKLANHQNLLVSRPFDPNELMPRKVNANEPEKVNEKEGHPREFAGLDPEEQIKFIKEGGEIQKVRSWKAMNPSVRKIYIQSILRSNYTTKINNFDLLKAIKNTGYDMKLDSKLKEIGVEKGITKLINDFITTDFTLEYMGKKDKNINVYSSKSNGMFCIYDSLNAGFVKKDSTIYDERFERGKNIRLKNKENNLYLFYQFLSPNGDEFYILNDDPFGGDKHTGYIMSKKGFGVISEDLQLKAENFKFDPNNDNVDMIGEINYGDL